MRVDYLLIFFLVLVSPVQLLCQNNSNNDKNIESIVCTVLPKAEFPGGQDSLFLFIRNNLKWPSPDFCGQGIVVVSFIVRKSGELSDINIIRSLCEECDKEAMRVIKLMPKWIPPTKNGVRIKTRIQFPIIFGLD